MLFGDRVFLADDFDTSAARGASRFKDKHVFEVVHFPVVQESLIILGKDISLRTNVEFLTESTSLFLNIPPEVGF